MPTPPIAPCLPTKAPHPPSGAAWVHEIKHDGFRIIARKDGPRVRLFSRLGNDRTDRFPRIVDALSNYRFDSEDTPPLRLRLKIEINSREHFAVFGFVDQRFVSLFQRSLSR